MKNNCERYARAITDDVLGQALDMPKEELTAHLKECAQCREELTNWQDFLNFMRVKEYYARPEVKEKWNRFIKELTSPVHGEPVQGKPALVKPVRGEKILDNQGYIGDAAGKVWLLLAKNSKIPLTSLPRKTKLPPYIAYSAMGWLAKENKVYYTKTKQNTFVYLNETERNIYQQRQARV